MPLHPHERKFLGRGRQRYLSLLAFGDIVHHCLGVSRMRHRSFILLSPDKLQHCIAILLSSEQQGLDGLSEFSLTISGTYSGFQGDVEEGASPSYAT